MKKISVYSLLSFFPAFLFSVALFSFFLFWGVFFEKTFLISKGGASFSEVLRLAALQTPSLMSLVIPIASMTGAFFSFRKMISCGEWKAFQAAGWAPFRIIKPVLLFSFFIALGHFLFSEFIAVRAFSKYREFYNVEIKKRAKSEYEKINAPVFKSGDAFFKAAAYDARKKVFYRLYGLKFEQDEPVYSVFASSASYNKALSSWIFESGGEFFYKKSGNEYAQFKSKKIDLLPLPENLVFQNGNPNSENFFSLFKRIKRLEEMGLKRKEELIVFFQKLASPLASFVMIAVAAAVAMSPLGAYGFAGAGFSLLFGFAYWGAAMTLERMAEIELLNPALAVFAAPIFFSIAAYLALKKFKSF